MRGRRRSITVAAAGLAALTAMLSLGPGAYGNGPPSQAGPATSRPQPRPAVRQVGYFIQWGIYGRAFYVKNLDTSGAAGKLTHLDYAFAKVAPEVTPNGTEITCQSADP